MTNNKTMSTNVRTTKSSTDVRMTVKLRKNTVLSLRNIPEQTYDAKIMYLIALHKKTQAETYNAYKMTYALYKKYVIDKESEEHV